MFGYYIPNPTIAIIMMVIFLGCVLLGFPIAFTLMAMGIIFGYYAYFDWAIMDHILDNRIFGLFVQNTYTVMDIWGTIWPLQAIWMATASQN